MTDITIKAYLDAYQKADGTRTSYLRVTQGRSHKYIKLDYSLLTKHWNKTPKQSNDGIWQYVKKHSRAKAINEYLTNKINDAKEIVNTLPDPTLEKAYAAILKGKKTDSFFSYAEEIVERKKKNYETWRQYRSSINKFQDFVGENDLTLAEIDHSFLERYRNYLYAKGNHTNTINTAIKRIRAIMYSAIREGQFPQEKNPFFTFKLELEKTMKEALNLVELDRIIDLELPKDTLIWHVRNYFLLSFYLHGIRVRDFIQLKSKNFQEDRLTYQMSKTKDVKSIKLHTKSKALLSHYLRNEALPEDYVFPILDNQRDYSDWDFLHRQISAKNALINKYLKKLAKKAEITKKLSFHVARHSFANVARDKIGDITKIQRMLGHKDIQTTQIYLGEIQDTSLDSDSDLIYG